MKYISLKYNGQEVRRLYYTVTDDCVTIVNGWNVPKRIYDLVLDEIKMLNPDCKVWERKRASLKLEWACHSFLYQMQIARERTKDVDLDYPNKKAWLYCICGVLCWIFA
ncbi:MAG: hypothetical protein KBS70_08230 [Bacteroidales bacterium]|nr:hypothetical protein [Candidatus Colicola equi]